MKRVTIAFLCFAVCSGATGQQRLREGIILEPARNTAYVMTPEGGIAAIELTSGAVQWTTNAAAKPLAVVGNRLLAQIESKTATQRNLLQLTALDLREKGAQGVRNVTTLPANVRVGVTETLDGRFSASATGSGATALVNWTYVPMQRLRGMPTLPGEEEIDMRSRAARRPEPITGSVRMSLSTGAMSTAPATRNESPANTPTWLIPASEIDASPATQYQSADGRHVLTSLQVAEDPEWNKYRWVVTDRETGQRLGEFRNHIAFAPFVVRDSVIVFETTPYIRGDDEEPAKLRGVDLQTGREAWSVEVREVVFRGTMPP